MIVTVSKAKKCIMETVKIETSTFPVIVLMLEGVTLHPVKCNENSAKLILIYKSIFRYCAVLGNIHVYFIFRF
jgi:hypothetical protein